MRDWLSYCMCVWLTHMNQTLVPLIPNYSIEFAITLTKIPTNITFRLARSLLVIDRR